MTDPQARLLAVQNDEADIALYPPTAAKPVVDKLAGVYFNYGTPGTGGFMIFLNVQRAPYNDPQVRRAINKGIDYAQIANEVFYGVFDVAESWYAPIFPYALKNQRTDIEGAKRLLAEAGWTPGADGIRTKDGQRLTMIMLIYPQQPDLVPMSNALQNQLKQIGIDVQIQSVDDINNALLKSPTPWDAGLISTGTTSWGSPEPTLRRLFVTGGSRNYAKFSNAEIDALTAELAATVDEDRRTAILQRIQTIMVEEEAYAWNLNMSKGRVIVNERYRDYQPGFSLFHISWQTQPTKAN